MEYKILEEMFRDETPTSVFEIGCANGGLLKDLKSHYPNIVVGGMEISRSIEECKKEFGADNFYKEDINDPWPIKDKAFDIVFSVGVLMYMTEPMHVLREMLRVGKKIIIAEYHHDEISLWGQLTNGYINKERIQTGIIRDYISLFHVMKLHETHNIAGYQSSQSKTIFKLEPKNV
jgi:SAM-dependent methyltransferase